MIEDSIVLQVWLFVMLLVFFACKMKGFCCRFLKKINKYCYICLQNERFLLSFFKKFNKYCFIYNIFCTFALDKAY